MADADFRIVYEGGDADGHAMDMRALALSMLGAERIISDGLIILTERRLPRRGERAPVIYPDVPFEPSAGCVWLCCELELAIESAALGAVQRFVAVRGTERRVLREIRLGEL